MRWRGEEGIAKSWHYEQERDIKTYIADEVALNTKVPKEVPPNQSYELPKLNGGDRQLGIPTVMDRMIQQAIVQVISPICEPHFSETSYGFKPERSCEKAIIKLLKYLNDGYEWIVAIDLEKFFDTVPQDRLMSLVHNMIQDGNTESLIRKYLHSGVVVNGQRQKTPVGTPQGGNLSSLLSNIMLNELDKELESRGLHFVCYADDCVITVASGAAAKRVMHSISRFIEQGLGLKVNMTNLTADYNWVRHNQERLAFGIDR